MKPVSIRCARALALAALVVSVAVSHLDAQVRRGRATTPEAAPWAPISIGLRFGYDQEVRTQLLGATLRIPVVRSGVVELNPSVDNLFVRGQDDRQYNLDVTYAAAGPRGGLILFGGVAWRESIFGLLVTERTRFFGYNAGAGGRTRAGPLEIEALIKWTFLNDTELQPNFVSIGVNLPLWGAGVPGR